MGRALSQDVTAVVASPGFDAAAMDGYAVCGTGPWRVVGRVLAGGAPWPGRLAEGEAVEIGTGAVVADGARAVIPYEDCRVEDGTVVADPPGKRHIRGAGEDFQAGEVIARAGQLVTGTVAAGLAQSGVDAVEVFARPSVWLIVTGDEVIGAGVPEPGQVRDAHTAVVAALTGRAGGALTGRAVIGDDPRVLLEALDGAGAADVVAVSGSSSAGRADHLRPVLAEMGGRWLVDGVRCRPGHPQGLGQTADGRWVVSLPGNPFAGLVAGLTLLEPLVSSLSGRRPENALRLPVFGSVTVYRHGVRLVPVTFAGGRAVVVAGSRPGSLHAVAQADAVAVIEPSWAEGMDAELLLLP